MRAAAQFHGSRVTSCLPHGNHAHYVAVFFIEQGHGAGAHSLIMRHFFGGNRVIRQNEAVHLRLDGGQFIRLHRRNMGEVKTQTIRRDQRTGLVHMRAQYLAQRGVQQMRGRMVAGGGHARALLHCQFYFLIGQDFTFLHFHMMGDNLLQRLDGIDHFGLATGEFQQPGIAALAAGCAVERRARGDHIASGGSRKNIYRQCFFIQQGHNTALAAQRIIPEELGLHAFILKRLEAGRHVAAAFILAGRAGTRLLFLHVADETLGIHREAALDSRVLHDVKGEAVGVIKPERHFAGKHPVARFFQRDQLLFQQGQALVQSQAETILFLVHHTLKKFGIALQFGISVAHQIHNLGHGLVHERFVQAHEGAEAQCAADETAQYIAPPFI